MPLLESLPLNLANAAAVTRNFVAFGLNVIVSTPLRRQDWDDLMHALGPLGVPTYGVTLDPGMAVALTNRGTRALTEWELRRIPQLYAEGYHTPAFGIIIDNAHQTPEETARELIAIIEEGNNAAT